MLSIVAQRNKMQAETAGFAPDAATWRTERIIRDNILHCRKRRTEPWPKVTCTENCVKFGRVVLEICDQTEKQTDRQTR